MLTSGESERRNALKASKPRVYEKMSALSGKFERGESIAIIQLQYSYKCNLRCKHCSIKPMQGQRRRSLTPADVASLADQADRMGLARFVITGGEPLTFSDLDAVVAAIGPQRFYINCDSNGWELTAERARHLKSVGVDRIQLSIDSLDAEAHDAFRGCEGSHFRAMAAAGHALDAGLGLFIQTVVDRTRLHSREFLEFLKHFNAIGVGVFVTYAKPVGAWEGSRLNLVAKADMDYLRELEKAHHVFTHLTPAYGIDMGCIAIKGMVSVTQYGDVQPCPYIHASLGNVFEEPLDAIIGRGMGLPYFKGRIPTCPVAEDREFIAKYIDGRISGRPHPAPALEVFRD